jgi:hypothetical protein
MTPPPRNARATGVGETAASLGDLIDRRARCERAASICGNYDKVTGRCREAKCFCFEVDDCERWHQVPV